MKWFALRDRSVTIGIILVPLLILLAVSGADQTSQAAFASVQRQYALGAVSYLEVLASGQQAQQVRIELATAQARQLIDAVALHQAVGRAPRPSQSAEPIRKEEP